MLDEMRVKGEEGSSCAKGRGGSLWRADTGAQRGRGRTAGQEIDEVGKGLITGPPRSREGSHPPKSNEELLIDFKKENDIQFAFLKEHSKWKMDCRSQEWKQKGSCCHRQMTGAWTGGVREFSGQHDFRFKGRTRQGCKGKRRARKVAGFPPQAAEPMRVPSTEMVTTKEQI